MSMQYAIVILKLLKELSHTLFTEFIQSFKYSLGSRIIWTISNKFWYILLSERNNSNFLFHSDTTNNEISKKDIASNDVKSETQEDTVPDIPDYYVNENEKADDDNNSEEDDSSGSESDAGESDRKKTDPHSSKILWIVLRRTAWTDLCGFVGCHQGLRRRMIKCE